MTVSISDHMKVKKLKTKEYDIAHAGKVKAALACTYSFLRDDVSDRDRHMIASTLCDEMNALLYLEQQCYDKAIGLLEEQFTCNLALRPAIDALKRLIREGKVLQAV